MMVTSSDRRLPDDATMDASSRAVMRPSPVVDLSSMMMWPDCSPPSRSFLSSIA
ncbi:MAG: hypothetical protein BWY85_01844 [Firmicutes bacterium ADurb.Bin506]|nr:MAG: hypothetical protein BWY85_01844 [Firmicutes bacterium ADurb.Bin506]